MIAAPEGISIKQMRKFTADRFQTFELLNWTLNMPQPKNPTPPNLKANAGVTDETPDPKKKKDRWKRGKGQEENGNQETLKKPRGNEGARRGRETFRPPAIPYCLFCQASNKAPTSPLHYLS